MPETIITIVVRSITTTVNVNATGNGSEIEIGIGIGIGTGIANVNEIATSAGKTTIGSHVNATQTMSGAWSAGKLAYLLHLIYCKFTDKSFLLSRSRSLSLLSLALVATIARITMEATMAIAPWLKAAVVIGIGVTPPMRIAMTAMRATIANIVAITYAPATRHCIK